MFERFRQRLEQMQRWESAMVYALAAGEDASIFAWPLPLLLPLGLFQTLCFRSRRMMPPSLGILFIAETWLVGFLVLSVPFWLYGFSPVDALFESVSGFTTTGASIVADIEALPNSLLLWRGLVQWAGGITVVLIFTFLLPMLGVGSSSFVSNEFVGSDSETYTARVTNRAFRFIETYFLLTVVEIVILCLLDTGVLNAFCIAFSNIPTGGQLPQNDSMAGYGIEVQAVTLVFMFLGATNYYLLFRTIFRRDAKSLFRNEELQNMFLWFLLCIAVITAVLLFQNDFQLDRLFTPEARSDLWEAAYCVVSAGTSTGFAIVDYKGWPILALMVLVMAEFVGGMSGSTSGGVKIHRLIVLRSYINTGLKRMIHPNAIANVRVNNQNMSSSMINSAISTIILFMVTTAVAMAVLMVLEPELDLESYLGITVAFISNTGISIGYFGPMDSYAPLADSTKLFLCFLMWMGRMELVMALMLFTKNFWTDVRLNLGTRGRSVNLHNLVPRRPQGAPAACAIVKMTAPAFRRAAEKLSALKRFIRPYGTWPGSGTRPDCPVPAR